MAGKIYVCGGTGLMAKRCHDGVSVLLWPEADQQTRGHTAVGWAGPQPVRSVECFDPDYSRQMGLIPCYLDLVGLMPHRRHRDRWSPMPPMLVARFSLPISRFRT